MHRLTTFLLSTVISFPLIAAEPKPIENPDRFCEDAKELASITAQLPDYALSWQADTPVVVLPPLKFDPRAVLSAARGQPVCIAVVIDESGAALDAAAYFPKRVALSKNERKQVLANQFQPATHAGVPIKSIMVMKAWLQ
jgi:hypothetical protein